MDLAELDPEFKQQLLQELLQELRPEPAKKPLESHHGGDYNAE